MIDADVLEYAMCVASDPIWTITAASQAEHATWVASRLIDFDVSPTPTRVVNGCTQPERGGGGGEMASTPDLRW